MSRHSDGGEDDTDDEQKLVPRDFQIHMVERALSENIITFLGTGTGKTLIAVMLMEKMMAQPRSDPAATENSAHAPRNFRRALSWFLADRVNLVIQQSDFIASTSNSRIRPVALYGSLGVDTWRTKQWTQCCEQYDAVVSTPQILLNALRHGMLDLSAFKLLIFDEAHHATARHPYNRIMREFYFELEQQNRPRIFGMSAAGVKKKGAANADQTAALFHEYIVDLESNLDAALIAPPDTLHDEIERAAPRAEEFVVQYDGLETDLTADVEVETEVTELEDLDDLFMNVEESGTAVKDEQKIAKVVATVQLQLGNWAAEECRRYMRRDKDTTGLPTQLSQVITTSKVGKFLSILCSERKRSLDSEEKDFRCIVFTRMRFMAWALDRIMSAVTEISNIAELRSGFIAGHTAGNLISLHRQKKVIRNFRDGTFNILIATNVVEEGFDVPACNVVVMFDEVSTTLAYVQSSGRARHKDSRYICMEPSNSFTSKCSLAAAKVGAQVLQTIVRDENPRPRRPVYPFSDTNALRSRTTSARIPIDACKDLLDRYCVGLPSDGSEKEEDTKPRYNVFGNACVVTLPTGCPVVKAASPPGTLELGKGQLESLAALEALRELYERGELDEHLLPPVDVFAKMIVPLRLPAQPREETSKALEALCRMSFNPPSELQWNPDPCCHDSCGSGSFVMHVYKLKDEVPQTDFFRKGGWKEETFGLLLSKPLDALQKFEVRSLPSGDLSLTLEASTAPICVNETQIRKLRRFTTLIRAIVVNRPAMVREDEMPLYGYLFAPVGLGTNGVDWNSVTRALDSWDETQKARTADDKIPIICHPDKGESLQYSVILSIHDGHKFFYHSGKLDKDWIVGGQRRFGRDKSVAHHYKRRGLHDVVDLSQPVLECWRFCPIDGKRSATVLSKPSVLVPECCRNVLVSPVAVRLMKRLPTMEKMWTIEAFRKTIQWDGPILGFSRALTSRTSLTSQERDWDYERLEWLGDTALKLCVGIETFCRFPAAQEGVLTKYRDLVVRNEHLYEQGVKLNLQTPVKMSCVTVEFKKWKWPLGTYKETTQLSKKVIADSVEAMLGLTLSTHGISGVKQVIDKFDLLGKLQPSHTLSEEDIYIDPRAQHENISHVESIWNYKFEDRQLAVEALTHKSYRVTDSRSKSMGRLEYLGDAVIGMIVVLYLFQRFPDKGVEELNKLKGALLSNRFFGKFVIERGLHKYLWCTSEPMQNSIQYMETRLEGKMNDVDVWEDLAPDKFFADLFEATVGAIFVDLGYDYEKARAVVFPIVEKPIQDYILSPLAQNPIADLGEKCMERLKRQPRFDFRNLNPSAFQSERVICTVYIDEKAVSEHKHVNKDRAKHFAAKKALAKLNDESFVKTLEVNVGETVAEEPGQQEEPKRAPILVDEDEVVPGKEEADEASGAGSDQEDLIANDPMEIDEPLKVDDGDDAGPEHSGTVHVEDNGSLPIPQFTGPATTEDE